MLRVYKTGRRLAIVPDYRVIVTRDWMPQEVDWLVVDEGWVGGWKKSGSPSTSLRASKLPHSKGAR